VGLDLRPRVMSGADLGWSNAGRYVERIVERREALARYEAHGGT
jgi:hypothetical protein